VANKTGVAREQSSSTDDLAITKAKASTAPAEASSSSDSVDATRSVAAPTIGPETSTSTDSVLVTQGRTATESSTSTDQILSITKTTVLNPSEQSVSSDGVITEFHRADIADYEFVLVEPVANTLPFIPFGGSQEITGKFSPGGFEVADQDQAAVLGDYRMFGTDRHAPPVWAWSLFTQSDNAQDALEWLDIFKSVWNSKVRRVPEQVLACRYQVAGRMRRVYGRPRRFSPVTDQINIGKVRIECDFTLAEDVYYTDDESSVQVGATASVGVASGIIVPQPLPWVFTTQAPPLTAQAIIGGTEKTWVDVDFYGPCSNPWVKIGSLTWGLNGSLLNGEVVTLSGKPWSMGLRRPDGTNLPGWLDSRSRLSALQVDPGTYSVQYGAWDNTGTSHAVVRWRPAYQSL
jgi:hypothetical protein